MSLGFTEAPRAGLEPATLRLTAECSTIELSRIKQPFGCLMPALTSAMHECGPGRISKRTPLFCKLPYIRLPLCIHIYNKILNETLKHLTVETRTLLRGYDPLRRCFLFAVHRHSRFQMTANVRNHAVIKDKSSAY